MADWLQYSLADFLLFSPTAYWRLFEQLNVALWPLQPVALAMLTAVTVTAVRGARQAGWAVGAGLAVSWALVAQFFFAMYYAPINWAVEGVIPVVWAQAALTLALAPGLRFALAPRSRWLAYALLALAIAYPLVGLLAGRPWAQAELAGLAPDPTALMAIGLLMLARPGLRAIVLGAMPALWLIFSGMTLFAMEEVSAWVLFAALGCAAVVPVFSALSARK